MLAVVPTDARALAFTPDGQLLATAGGPVSLWGLGTERPIRTFKGPTGLVRSIAVSPDGKTMATAGGDGVVTLWDVAKGEPLASSRRAHRGGLVRRLRARRQDRWPAAGPIEPSDSGTWRRGLSAPCSAAPRGRSRPWPSRPTARCWPRRPTTTRPSRSGTWAQAASPRRSPCPTRRPVRASRAWLSAATVRRYTLAVSEGSRPGTLRQRAGPSFARPRRPPARSGPRSAVMPVAFEAWRS